MTTHNCDRCGRMIENYYDSPREYYIRKVETDAFKADSQVDLCDDCYNEFISWICGGLSGRNLTDLEKSLCYREGYMKAKEEFQYKLKEFQEQLETKNE